ncbi:MAG: hypothetical protein ABW049_05515, partial [Spongiibacteraceae bacterium]
EFLVYSLEGNDYFSVPLGIGEIVEGLRNIFWCDAAGNNGFSSDIAFGQIVRCLFELSRRIIHADHRSDAARF